MPVKLFTGLPGAGKTACLVAEMVQLRDKHPERPVYARGIDGLAPGIADDLTDELLHHWWDLPSGAILCIDECQEPGLMPQDRGQPADWVRRISKVRHEGMDFLLTTQHPNMISSYVRRLVDQHVHAVRKFNTHLVDRYTWGRCVETPEKASTQKGAVKTVGTLPSKVFELYKSATAHTMQRRIPKKVYLLVALGLVLVAAVVSMPLVFRHLRQTSAEGIRAGTPVASAGAVPKGSAVSSVDDDLRRADYAAWMRPRVAGLVWTAPAFDGQAVQSRPALYCIAVDDGRCACLSEQGTRVQVEPRLCRSIAADGVYNPFLAPGGAGDGGPAPADGSRPVAPVEDAGAGSVAGPGMVGRAGGIPQGHFAPEETPANQ